MSRSPLRPAAAPHTNKPPGAPCPYCGSHAITRKGVRKKKLEVVQLWRCASCKRLFTPGPAAPALVPRSPETAQNRPLTGRVASTSVAQAQSERRQASQDTRCRRHAGRLRHRRALKIPIALCQVAAPSSPAPRISCLDAFRTPARERADGPAMAGIRKPARFRKLRREKLTPALPPTPEIAAYTRKWVSRSQGRLAQDAPSFWLCPP